MTDRRHHPDSRPQPAPLARPVSPARLGPTGGEDARSSNENPTAIGPERAADLRPRTGPPELDAPTGEQEESGRWDWAHLSGTDAVYLADALTTFVAYFNGRYAWTREQTIPPCWSQHGALVEEVTTLMWSRWAAFEGPLAGPETAQTWHTYHLPLFLARITTWIGIEAAADCRAGHHQPSRLTGPERPHNTGRPPTTSRARP